jgi:hypothetical protein
LPLCIVSFLTCTSWFILGKSHSFIHVHMNYVLWYFGSVQVSLYIVLKFFIGLFRKQLLCLIK